MNVEYTRTRLTPCVIRSKDGLGGIAQLRQHALASRGAVEGGNSGDEGGEAQR